MRRPAVDHTEIDAALAAVDERVRDLRRGRSDVPRQAEGARKHAVPPAGRTPIGSAPRTPFRTSFAVPSPPIDPTASNPLSTASDASSTAWSRRSVSTSSTSQLSSSARSAARTDRSRTPEATGLTIRRRRGRATASASLEARLALLEERVDTLCVIAGRDGRDLELRLELHHLGE